MPPADGVRALAPVTGRVEQVVLHHSTALSLLVRLPTGAPAGTTPMLVLLPAEGQASPRETVHRESLLSLRPHGDPAGRRWTVEATLLGEQSGPVTGQLGDRSMATGVGPGLWRLVVRTGPADATELALAAPPAAIGPTRSSSPAPDGLVRTIAAGADGQAVLRVAPSPPAVVVGRVTTGPTELEFVARLPVGWSPSSTRFEALARSGEAAGGDRVGLRSRTTGAGADRRIVVVVDLARFPAPRTPTAVWDLWAGRGQDRLRVGRVDSDLISLRAAHRFAWAGVGTDVEVRLYFTDDAGLALEVRAAIDPSGGGS